jgi:NAD+ diphosphatase
MEEVGLKVRDLRYYKSQPWGIDGNILMGFFCRLDGSRQIHLDRTELAMAD